MHSAGPGPPVLWVFFLIVGMAALVRQYLFAHSYWYDEAYLILGIRGRSGFELLGPQPYNQVIPPLFLWLTRALYVLGGDGELVLRLPAFAAGVGALIVMIPLAMRLGRPAALWAFAGVAVSGHLLEHSCDVHPYTFDLLSAEVILLCGLVVIDSAAARRTRIWAIAGLGFMAAVGPWSSFPSAFVLAAASAAVAFHLWWSGSRAGWILWSAFNVLAATSGLTLWVLSGRHMYYPGMMDYWGPLGMGGFPDWTNPASLCWWVLKRPYEVASYASRDLGPPLVFLAVVGTIMLANRRRAVAVLFVGPFVGALVAALAGKYPLAHRTGFFLLPCVWLLAAQGIAAVVESAGQRGRLIVRAGWVALAWNFAWLCLALVRPAEHVDYRGAYRLVHANRRAGDAFWSQMAVVHETYYPGDPSILSEGDFAEVERSVGRKRVWTVFDAGREDLKQRLAAAGGRVVADYRRSGLRVLLMQPAGGELPSAELPSAALR